MAFAGYFGVDRWEVCLLMPESVIYKITDPLQDMENNGLFILTK
jgi:hypothetical protein